MTTCWCSKVSAEEPRIWLATNVRSCLAATVAKRTFGFWTMSALTDARAIPKGRKSSMVLLPCSPPY